METSPVPTHIQLGATLTDGLGAGASPTVGRNAALENSEDIRAILEKGTKMLFITAGLGGGTGTGAAPVIAQISRELGILTVGIVTIPFAFEGRKRRLSADEGIRQLKQHVDALLIISNDKLRLLHGDLPLSAAFSQADNVLTTAAKGIAEIITVVGYINVDFEDVKTVMKNSGVAIMGTGVANGQDRARNAVEQALNSPLLDNNDISGSGNILLYISSGTKEITMDEVTAITDYIQEKTKSNGDIIWGNGYDDSLEDKISVTIIATGFDEDHRPQDPILPGEVRRHELYPDSNQPSSAKKVNQTENKPSGTGFSTQRPPFSGSPVPPVVPRPEAIPPKPTRPEPIIHTFEPEKEEIVTSSVSKQTELFETEPDPVPTSEVQEEIREDIIIESPDTLPEAFDLEPDLNSNEPGRTFEFILKEKEMVSQPEKKEVIIHSFNPAAPAENITPNPSPVPVDTVRDFQVRTEPQQDNQQFLNKKSGERVNRLRELSEKLKGHIPIEQNLEELEQVPAYIRRNVDIRDIPPSSASNIANLDVSGNPEKPIDNKTNNPYLNPSTD
jgi:cell division protein FtsZ